MKPQTFEYESINRSNRIAWIDTAKGIAMILVFYGHLGGSGDNPWFPGLTGSIWVVYLFHMPLFFMLSGLTFNPHKDFRTFLVARCKRLVIPYFFFSIYALGKILLLIVAPSVVKGFHGRSMGNPMTEFINILLGNTTGLWFFLALFWGDLALYGLHKLTVHSSCRILVLSLIFVASGLVWFVMNFFGVYEYAPFQLLRATEAIAFVGIGWLISSRLKTLSKRESVFLLGITFVAFIGVGCLIHYLEIYNVEWWGVVTAIPCLFAAICGSLMTMAIAQLVPAWRWVTYIGRNTMVFYGLNGLSMAISRKIIFILISVSLVASQLVLQIIIGLVVVAGACLICAAATLVLNRWCWWGIGLPNPHKRCYSAKHATRQTVE
ncbi:acyltransferase family protein [Bifidobacterium pseudolongum]|uniref:acyltransferase family protein n=1 Tax=Bifidobacterium pseudolongum TaxID=1694 RepID=UPI0010CEA7F6|nr:acyltransferase [Bifidobacterium pseudolongum]RYQ54702.1 acyltransferase [Bifidobacterium pseudolongum subsp. globosum]RYQ77408.1 acyltransferase [Bifidobacterium pseudolongum subsp. globosum]